MAICSSCGGDNPSQAVRCEYCDRPLESRAQLDVAWTARTERGVSGEGHAGVDVPGGTDPQRVRSRIDAAFSLAVERLGTGASAEEIGLGMEEVLSDLLPAGCTLTRLEVTSFSAFLLLGRPAEGGAAPRARALGPAGPGAGAAPAGPPGPAAGRGCPASLLLLAAVVLGLCCLSSGALSLLGSLVEMHERRQLAQAAVVSPEEAGAASGLVCVEATVAAVASALVTPHGIPCLYIEETLVEERTHARPGPDGAPRPASPRRTVGPPAAVASFRLGDLEVRPEVDRPRGARFTDLEELPAIEEEPGEDGLARTRELRVIRADRPITVVGTVTAGVMHAGGPSFRVSTVSTREELVRSLSLGAGAAGGFGCFATLVGAAVLLACLATRRRRR